MTDSSIYFSSEHWAASTAFERRLPYKVVINEAVELAKAYGEDSSSSFVNGVLANIVKDVEE